MTPVSRYFEDYPVGEVAVVGTFSVSREQIVEFARQYDPQPFHLDEDAALAGPFGGLAASGWQTAALMMREVVDGFLDPASSLGSPGLDELRWLAPLRPDVTMTVGIEVLDKRVSASRPDRGILHSRMTVTDPDGLVVLSALAVSMIRLRP